MCSSKRVAEAGERIDLVGAGTLTNAAGTSEGLGANFLPGLNLAKPEFSAK
jgi:hypothetical protein